MPTAIDGEHLSALITFKFSAKITHTPGILIPGDFDPDRGGGHVLAEFCEFSSLFRSFVESTSHIFVWKIAFVFHHIKIFQNQHVVFSDRMSLKRLAKLYKKPRARPNLSASPL